MMTGVETPDAVVAGGGPAGLAAALALTRTGARVAVVERDRLDRGVPPEGALSIDRQGIAHYQAPHAFLPRGAKVLRERAHDVYNELLDLGALELPIARDQPDVRPEDSDLMLLCVRRPLIEWALREAVSRESLVDVVSARVEGIRVAHGTVVGLETSSGEVHAPLVVDAMGRTSRARRWLADGGVAVPEESHEVGIAYYSRYYQLLTGAEFPASAHPYGPRLDLGYALCATFLGDNGTFAIALMVPSWDRELKALREPARHHACCAALPDFQDWVDPTLSRPITEVSCMGALRTTWRGYELAAPEGFVAVADAFCHTDPSFALGLSLGLVHGFALADALERGDLRSFFDDTVPELRERFELARDVSETRLARLRGEESRPSPSASTFAALTAAARDDPDLFRIAFRRAGFLDRLGPVDRPLPAPANSPASPVSREDLLAIIAAA
jgi:2-polyprenyl-6-methoxyphenol hydroxylase-like FAD-dependent oxidoreductase